MAVEVRLPASLCALSAGESVVTAEGSTVGEVIASLERSYPGMAERLLDDSGLRRYVNVYLNGAEIRFREGLLTPVTGADSITILPTVAAAL